MDTLQYPPTRRNFEAHGMRVAVRAKAREAHTASPAMGCHGRLACASDFRLCRPSLEAPRALASAVLRGGRVSAQAGG